MPQTRKPIPPTIQEAERARAGIPVVDPTTNGAATPPEPDDPILEITIAGEARTLNTADLGPRDDIVSARFHPDRVPITGVIADVRNLMMPGPASFAWWYAGRLAGNTDTFEDVLTRFPRHADLEPYDVRLIDPDTDDVGSRPDPTGSDDPPPLSGPASPPRSG